MSKKNKSPWPENDLWHADVIYTPTVEELAKVEFVKYLVSTKKAQPGGPSASLEYRVGMASVVLVKEMSEVDDSVEYVISFSQYNNKGDYRIHHAHPCVEHHEFHRHNVYDNLVDVAAVIRHFIAFEHHRNEDIVAIQVGQNVAAEIRGMAV